MKILAFGTFDLFHKGHEFYLKYAKSLGEELYVVVARDETVNKIKGFFPDDDENKRVETVALKPYVKDALLGDLDNKYFVLDLIKPDVICLGYDQKDFIDNLKEEIESRGLKTKVVRAKSFRPHEYKSSIFRAK